MERWINASKLLLVIFAVYILHINAQQVTGKRDYTCASENLQRLTIGCDFPESILVTRAIYVKPLLYNSFPNCQYSQPGIGDLVLDLETILSYHCEGKSECDLALEWGLWEGITNMHSHRWQGGAYFQVEYTCADPSLRQELPIIASMVSNRIRNDDNVHMYGCHGGEQYPTSLALECTNGVIEVGNAVIGKTSRQEGRCHRPGGSETRNAHDLTDATFNLQRTVDHSCNGKTTCTVPVDWINVLRAIDTLNTHFPDYYTGDLYLDVVYTCFDEIGSSTTVFEPNPNDLPPHRGGADGDDEKEKDIGIEKAPPSGSGDFPLMAFGGIGIGILVLVTVGIIGFSHYVRRRRLPNVQDFMDPTYNTTVMRSKHALPPKFDNILYDADRHPSGVYDVPRSASTTPGVSCHLPPDFAIDVKVEVEPDDDNLFEDPKGVCVATSYDIPAAIRPQISNSYANKPTPIMQPSPSSSSQQQNPYSVPYAENVVAINPTPSTSGQQMNPYSEPYAVNVPTMNLVPSESSQPLNPYSETYADNFPVNISTPLSSSQQINPYSDTYSDNNSDNRRSSATVETYVTMDNGQAKTVLENPNSQGGVPKLPPRTLSMPGPKESNDLEQDTAKRCIAGEVNEDVMNNMRSSSHSVLSSASDHSQNESGANPETGLQIYANVHEPKTTSKRSSGTESASISETSETVNTEHQEENIQSPEDETFETTSEYYRSLLRHQPVSGVYDNNMDNLPNSPHCLRQLNH